MSWKFQTKGKRDPDTVSQITDALIGKFKPIYLCAHSSIATKDGCICCDTNLMNKFLYVTVNSWLHSRSLYHALIRAAATFVVFETFKAPSISAILAFSADLIKDRNELLDVVSQAMRHHDYKKPIETDLVALSATFDDISTMVSTTQELTLGEASK